MGFYLLHSTLGWLCRILLILYYNNLIIFYVYNHVIDNESYRRFGMSPMHRMFPFNGKKLNGCARRKLVVDTKHNIMNKLSLYMFSPPQVDREDVRTRNVFISEAFLRFFMSVLAQFHRHFVEREILEGELGKGGVVFEVRISYCGSI